MKYPRQVKSISYLFLSLIMVLSLKSCGGEKNVNETPEAVGEAFFNVLKDNQPDGLKALFPGSDDWESMAKITMVPEDKIDEFREDFQRRIEMTHTNEVSRFNILLGRASEKGINLKKAKFDEVLMVREWTEEGLDLASVDVHFSVDGQNHKIFLGNIGKLDRGWFMNRVPNWKPGDK